jgi:hypothetical protein
MREDIRLFVIEMKTSCNQFTIMKPDVFLFVSDFPELIANQTGYLVLISGIQSAGRNVRQRPQKNFLRQSGEANSYAVSGESPGQSDPR